MTNAETDMMHLMNERDNVVQFTNEGIIYLSYAFPNQRQRVERDCRSLEVDAENPYGHEGRQADFPDEWVNEIMP